MDDSTNPTAGTSIGGAFASTHWSVVLLAGQRDDTEVRAALEQLCRTYWPPLYTFVRRRGHSREDAQDLTQEFFARLLGMNYLQSVDRERGRFRSFLLASLKHFLANEWDRVRAQKRGGKCAFISLEAEDEEERRLLEPAHDDTPERAFEQRWALAVLDRALTSLRDEFKADGKLAHFGALKAYLSSDAREGYHDMAAKLGMLPGAVAVTVHRMRRRYRECVRAEVANTVGSPTELDEEMQYLLSVLAG
jgi:RNA polymerase sigma-70 factor (ECF subfamily)